MMIDMWIFYNDMMKYNLNILPICELFFAFFVLKVELNLESCMEVLSKTN